MLVYNGARFSTIALLATCVENTHAFIRKATRRSSLLLPSILGIVCTRPAVSPKGALLQIFQYSFGRAHHISTPTEAAEAKIEQSESTYSLASYVAV